MKIIYIILNYKTYSDTIRVVNELLTNVRKDYKIIVVDNESPNESYEVLSSTFKGNEYVDIIQSGENGGYAKGNNFGLRYAKKYNPEYSVIMNNDVHFSWDTIDGLIEIYPKLEKPAVIAPIQMNPDGSRASLPVLQLPDMMYDLRSYSMLFRLPRHNFASNTTMPNVQRVGIIQGAFLFVNYKTFEQMGFFDECTFLFCEERFTGKAAKDLGLNNYLILNLQYVHEHSKTIGRETSSKFQRELIHKGKIMYTYKHRSCPWLKSLVLDICYYTYEWKLSLLRIIKKR